MVRVREVDELPQVDGFPRRAHTCINTRRNEKSMYDFLIAFWKMRGVALRQWDGFSIVFAAALDNPRLDVPEELRREGRRILDELDEEHAGVRRP